LDDTEAYIIDSTMESDSVAHRSRKHPSQSPQEIAKTMLIQAQEEAASLVSAAMAEADSIRSAAYQEGYQVGLHQMDDLHQEQSERFSEIKADVERRIEEFWTMIEPELLRLSVDISKKIVRQRIEEDNEFVLTTVRDAIRQLRDRQDLKIRVSPEDYGLLRERKEDIISSCDGIRTLEIIDDRRVDQGGCLIESGNGNLDARLETQFDEVESALMEAVEHGESEEPTEFGEV
jgi:flagellar assembly protein FliH